MLDASTRARLQKASLSLFLLLCLFALLSGALYENVFEANEYQFILKITLDLGLFLGFALCFIAGRRCNKAGSVAANGEEVPATNEGFPEPSASKSLAVLFVWAIGTSAAAMTRSGMLFSRMPYDLIAGDVLFGIFLGIGAWLQWVALSRLETNDALASLAESLGIASVAFIVLSPMPHGIILLTVCLLAPAACAAFLAIPIVDGGVSADSFPTFRGVDFGQGETKRVRVFPRVLTLSVIASIFIADLLMTLFPVALFTEPSPLFAPFAGTNDVYALGSLTEPALIAALILAGFSAIFWHMATKGRVNTSTLCFIGFFAVAVGFVTFPYHFPGGAPIGVAVAGQCIVVLNAVTEILLYASSGKIPSPETGTATGIAQPFVSSATTEAALKLAILCSLAMVAADVFVMMLYGFSAFDYMDFTVRTIFGGCGILALIALLLGPMRHTYDSAPRMENVSLAADSRHAADEHTQSKPEETLESKIAAFGKKYRLSPRETEVLSLLSQGRDVPYIEQELVLSKSTVKTHIRHIYAKCDVSSRQALLDLLLDEPDKNPQKHLQ